MTLTTQLCTPITRTIPNTTSKYRLASKTENTREAFATWPSRCPKIAPERRLHRPARRRASKRGWPIRRRAASMARPGHRRARRLDACARPVRVRCLFVLVMRVGASALGHHQRTRVLRSWRMLWLTGTRHLPCVSWGNPHGARLHAAVDQSPDDAYVSLGLA